MIRKLLNILVSMIVVVLIIGITVFFIYASRIPRLPDDLRLLASSPPTEIYARDGELLTSLGGRSYVSIDRISPHFQQAIVAAEDKRFFQHRGIDLIATFRSLFYNIKHGGRGPGGSTITQQLAKNMFFTFKRSWERKLLEALATVAIEDDFTKQQILEAYSNLVYFGCMAYGIENASIAYFSKHAAELKLHEAAMLAGIPNAPSRLNPFNNIEAAKKRQRIVLLRMAATGIIALNAVDSISSVPINLKKGQISTQRTSYPIDYAIENAAEQIDRDVIRYGGVKIITTVDPLLQRYAEQALATGLNDLEKRLRPLPEDADTRLEGALVAIEVATGQIVAMTGGRNYSESTYNRVLYARRHPGSAFKPVVYLTALEKTEFTPATVLVDTLISLPTDKRRTWSPQNFSKTYRGPVTLKFGLMKSINTISAQLIYKVGPEAVVKSAKRLGIKTKLKPLLALSLGAQSVTPLEMAMVYSTIAREGIALEPFIVKRIEGQGRDLLFESFSAKETRFAPEMMYILIDMLKSVVDDGTGKVIRRRGLKGEVIGKTGTSSDYRDSWFCGATPDLVVVVWVGYDDNRSMYTKNDVGVVGATGAAPIWADFMIRATAGQPLCNFHRPPGVITLFMDPVTGIVSNLPEKSDWIPVTLKEEDADILLEQSRREMEADSSANLEKELIEENVEGTE